MKCRKCGELVGSFAKECPVCGASLSEDIQDMILNEPKTVVNPEHIHQEDCSVDSHPGSNDSWGVTPSFGPLTAVQLFFTRFADFKGRARRSEYWWASLFVYILNMALTAIAPEAGSMLTVVLLIPSTALCIRRLHDVGKSGWWYLLIFVPFGAFVLLYWCCKDSDPNPNKWGYSPKY